MTYEQLQMSGLPSSESTERQSRYCQRDFLASLTALQEKVSAIVMSVTSGGEVARVIGEIRPRWFVGENTPGLFARANQRYFKRILADLAALGYSVGWGIWGACDVGAPHRRDRVFIVSYTACKRCHTHSIQRREFAQSRFTQNARRVQESGMQSKRVGCRISDAAGNELGVYGCTAEIEESRRKRNNYRSGTKRNAGGECWEIEPDVGRVAYGVSDRVDRLRCLGNAVVPQQIYPVFEAIAKFELRGNTFGRIK